MQRSIIIKKLQNKNNVIICVDISLVILIKYNVLLINRFFATSLQENFEDTEMINVHMNTNCL